MILTETRDRIARIELARPDKKNALTDEMYDAMATALAAFFEKRKPDFSRF